MRGSSMDCKLTVLLRSAIVPVQLVVWSLCHINGFTVKASVVKENNTCVLRSRVCVLLFIVLF